MRQLRPLPQTLRLIRTQLLTELLDLELLFLEVRPVGVPLGWMVNACSFSNQLSLLGFNLRILGTL